MGGGASKSKKYATYTCYNCTATATTKLFLNACYVPACDKCTQAAAAAASTQAPTTIFHPTPFIDMVSYVDETNHNKDQVNAVHNFLKGDFIGLIGPRDPRNAAATTTTTTTTTTAPITETQTLITVHVTAPPHEPIGMELVPSLNQNNGVGGWMIKEKTKQYPQLRRGMTLIQINNHDMTGTTNKTDLMNRIRQRPLNMKFITPKRSAATKPQVIPPRQRQVQAQLLVPTPVLEQVVVQETKSNANHNNYQPQFLVPGATPVQEEYYGDYGDEYGEYQQPYEEPLSWRYQPPLQEQHQQPEPEPEPEPEPLGSMSIGQRHCRYNRCPCSNFSNDPNKSTMCLHCHHGEMYHRSKTEAPLARVNIPGSGTCAHCLLNIVGGGFSGYYKEAKDGSILHDECWQLYKEAKAPKCQQCHVIILKNYQGFSGRYSKVSFGNGPKVKVHKECLQIYLECRRGDEH